MSATTPRIPSSADRDVPSKPLGPARHPIPDPIPTPRRVLGIQRRIMLYVVAGLGAMFAVLLPIGLRALGRATDLVFAERLTLVKSVDLIIERDLEHVIDDLTELVASDLADGASIEEIAADRLEHISGDSFAFFSAKSLWVVDRSGTLVGATSVSPSAEPPRPGTVMPPDLLHHLDAGSSLVPPFADDGTFGAIVATVDLPRDRLRLIVNLAAENSTDEFNSAMFGTPSGEDGDTYHLEVTDPAGSVVLGIGPDEQPGESSVHASVLSSLRPLAEPTVVEHLRRLDNDPPDHVMAISPLGDTGFVVVLEEPIDAALALPTALRRDLLLWSSIGIFVALILAWFTTRSVAAPAALLTQAAHRIEEGDLDTPITVSAHDEIGLLAESLESMRRRTKAAHSAVEAVNTDLEHRVAERTEHLGVLLGKIISAQEDERQRLARELHDQTAQTIGALAIAIERARADLPDDPGAALSHLERAQTIASSLLADTRRLILDLRPLVLDDMGLVPVVSGLLETHFNPQTVTTRLTYTGAEDKRLPEHIETALFRILQEALNNTARHAEASIVEVTLTFEDALVRTSVTDNGRGFAETSSGDTQDDAQHLGIIGMRERVTLLGGWLKITSSPGAGTVVHVEVPLLQVS